MGPFWNASDQAWQPAENLHLGERVLTASGRHAHVAGFDLTRSSRARAYNLAVEGVHTYHVGRAAVLVHNCDEYVDVLSPQDRRHILDGDPNGGGGHRWPGASSDKTPFPRNWSDDQTIHNVGDIVTAPTTKWYAQTGNGGMFTASGNPAIWRAWEVRDGVRIRVAYEPATGRVRTAFPDSNPASGVAIP